MNMRTKRHFYFWTIANLLLMASSFAACSSGNDPEPPEPITPKAYTLTVHASKGSNAKTRALAIDGEGKLNATWTAGDKVSVYKGGTHVGTLEAKSSGVNTTFTGTVSDLVKANDKLDIVYLTADYTGQDGTLSYIASHCDYATAEVTVNSVSGSNMTTTDADFINRQAIAKFTLVDEADGYTTLSPTAITLTIGETTIAATIPASTYTANGDGILYFAMPGFSSKDINIAATVGGHACSGLKTAITFEDGKYYAGTVNLYDPYKEPLTLEATGEEAQITFINNATSSVQFTRDLDNWENAYTIPSSDSRIFTLNSTNGKKIYFRGNNSTYYPRSSPSTISCTDRCYIYGNIMSLISSTGFAALTSLPDETNSNFRSLFKNNTSLVNHPYKEIVLPATTLKSHCYQEMFAGCTGLTKAPVLPAETLSTYCYWGMFNGCSNLAYIKCLATDISAEDCTTDWVKDTKSIGTFVKAPSMETWSPAWSTGDNGIPSGWTISTSD